MTIFSFYIFDRHTECIYSKKWLPSTAIQTSTPTTAAAAAAATDPHAPSASPALLDGASSDAAAVPDANGGNTASHANNNSRTTTTTTTTAKKRGARTTTGGRDRSGDDAKLIFGTVFSLRNMVRKLGGEDDAFVCYRTAHYKLHYYETASNLRFVLLTDTAALSMRNVLHQIYINLWVEYVVKNPLSPVEHKGGEGVRNELFELGLDQFVRGLN